LSISLRQSTVFFTVTAMPNSSLVNAANGYSCAL
jgi:hypothetical protein